MRPLAARSGRQVTRGTSYCFMEGFHTAGVADIALFGSTGAGFGLRLFDSRRLYDAASCNAVHATTATAFDVAAGSPAHILRDPDNQWGQAAEARKLAPSC